MYIIEVELSEGLGSVLQKRGFDTFGEMKKFAELAKSKDGSKGHKFLGKETTITVWRITYHYPSGKSYTERLH